MHERGDEDTETDPETGPARAGAEFTGASHPAPSRAAWIALVFVLALVAFVRVRLVDAPLERDEGEYAYAGRLILEGSLPYSDVYNMKLPGIYAAYAVLLAFLPDTAGGIHTGLLLVVLATTVLVFLLGRRLAVGPESAADARTRRARADLTGVLAAAAFGVLTLGKDIQGLFANAEPFVVLPAVAGLLLLLRGLSSSRVREIGASGLCFGVAFLVKQHGAAFGFFGTLWLAAELARGRAFAGRRLAALVVFVGSGLLPLLVTMGALAAVGIFDAFWWWTFEYARDYIAQVPIAEGYVYLRQHGGRVALAAPLIWGAAGVGLTALVWDRSLRGRRIFLALFAAFSLLSVCPGFFFRQHYFALMTPMVAVLAAVGFASLGRVIPGPAALVATVLAVASLGQSVAAQSEYLFGLSPKDVTRHTFPLNPFAESKEAGRIVAAYSKPDDRIAILGSEPQIAFYAGRRLATGFVYMYPLMEAHDYAETFQKQLVEEFTRNDPELVVYVTVPSSWLGTPQTHRVMREWMNGLGDRYVSLARIFVDPSGLGIVISPEQAEQLYVDVYKKKP